MGDMGTVDESSKVEDLILESLKRIETKFDTGFSDHARRIGALEVAMATIQTLIARSDAFWPRALPWLMFAWNILLVVIGGIVWLISNVHAGH